MNDNISSKDSFDNSWLRQFIVTTLQDIIRIPTENPPGNEKPVVDYLQKLLIKHGFKCAIYAKDKARPNLVAWHDKNGTNTDKIHNSNKPEIALCLHTDTVPVGDMEGWTSSPFSGKIIGRKSKAEIRREIRRESKTYGRIYGRGASDNKGQIAASIAAALILKKQGLKGRLKLVFLSDEETGSEFGMKFIAGKRLLKPKLAIVPDIGGSMRRVSIGEKGALFVSVTSYGKQAHGSTPEIGINAIGNLMTLLNEFHKLQKKYGLCGSQANVPSYARKLFTKPTYNLGVISGGSAPNIVPAKAEAKLDFRYLSGQSHAQILKMINDAANHAMHMSKAGSKAKFRIRIISLQKPIMFSNKEVMKAVQIIKEKTEEIAGIRPKAVGLSGSTVGKLLALTGVNVIGVGCGDDKEVHAQNESISIKELCTFAKVLAASINEMF